MNQSETPSTPITASSTGLLKNTPDGQLLDLLEVAILLLRGKKTILKFIVVSVLAMVIIVFFLLKPTYTANAVFLPPQESPGSGLTQLASQLGSMSALSALGGGLKSPGDIYIGILGSRTIADSIIKQFNLQSVYGTKKLSDTEKKLKNHSTFAAGKDTLVTINVEDHDPKRAADMANAYLAELYIQNGRLALTGASQRRLFFQQQLEHEKDVLADAEVDLKKTQEQTGIISPSDQSRAAVSSIEETRAEIAAREVELSSLRQSTTDQNPDVIRLQAQISSYQQQLHKLENGQESRQPGNIQLPTAQVPELELEYVRKEREVKYHEMLFDLLAKQYEGARLEESRDAPLLQVVDRAIVPDKKSGPPRMLLLLAGFLAGAFLGSLWVLLMYFVGTLKQNPSGAARLRNFHEAAFKH